MKRMAHLSIQSILLIFTIESWICAYVVHGQSFIDEDGYDCSFTGMGIQLDSRLTLRMKYQPARHRISMEGTYNGLGYVSFSFHNSSMMVPALTVIGLPSTHLVRKYNMTGKAITDIKELTNPLVYRTLQNSTIVQNTTHTILTYTRKLIGITLFGDQIDVYVEHDNNTIMWAYGATNDLGMHAGQGTMTIPASLFELCTFMSNTQPPSTTSNAPISTPPAVVTPVTTTTIPTAAPSVFTPGDTVAPETSITLPTATPLTELEAKHDDNSSSVGNGTVRSQLSTGLTTSIIGSKTNKTITVELTYEGIAWISLAVSPTGKMDASLAIAGSPMIGTVPKKYDMMGVNVKLAPEERQTLIDAIFEQNDTHTYLKFTKFMEEEGEHPIDTMDENIFLWAVGRSNDIESIHAKKGTFKWKVCDPSFDSCGGAVVSQSAVPRKTLWLAHGVFMTLAWVLLVPCAVAASVLRSILPKGPLWFTIHKSMNMMGVLVTIIGFLLAVVGTNQEGKKHFQSNGLKAIDRHYRVGFVIFLLAIVQALNGLFKPSATPHASPSMAVPAQPSESALLDEDGNLVLDDGNNDVESAKSSTTSPPLPVSGTTTKYIARVRWELYHRILGFALIGISWYNCDTGFRLYSSRYHKGSDVLMNALWGCICGLLGIFMVLYSYSKTK
jgi:hypothetical protein